MWFFNEVCIMLTAFIFLSGEVLAKGGGRGGRSAAKMVKTPKKPPTKATKATKPDKGKKKQEAEKKKEAQAKAAEKKKEAQAKAAEKKKEAQAKAAAKKEEVAAKKEEARARSEEKKAEAQDKAAAKKAEVAAKKEEARARNSQRTPGGHLALDTIAAGTTGALAGALVSNSLKGMMGPNNQQTQNTLTPTTSENAGKQLTNVRPNNVNIPNQQIPMPNMPIVMPGGYPNSPSNINYPQSSNVPPGMQNPQLPYLNQQQPPMQNPAVGNILGPGHNFYNIILNIDEGGAHTEKPGYTIPPSMIYPYQGYPMMSPYSNMPQTQYPQVQQDMVSPGPNNEATSQKTNVPEEDKSSLTTVDNVENNVSGDQDTQNDVINTDTQEQNNTKQNRERGSWWKSAFYGKKKSG